MKKQITKRTAIPASAQNLLTTSLCGVLFQASATQAFGQAAPKTHFVPASFSAQPDLLCDPRADDWALLFSRSRKPANT